MSKSLAAIAMAALALTGCTTMDGTSGSAALEHGRYVAIGSSMAAGPGLGQPKPETPARCWRTFANYPTLLAEKLRLTLIDVTCGGAKTEHVLGPWNELPAQIDAVTPDTRLVTITIGGNDLNYVGALVAAGCDENGKFTYQGQSVDCPSARAPDEDDFANVAKNLDEIALQVKKRAPGATLMFVEYLQLIPETLCAATPIASEHAASARAIANRLAEITANNAQRHGALLLPVHNRSASHTPCDETPYTNANPAGYDQSDGMIWHPNSAGMIAVANWAEQMLRE